MRSSLSTLLILPLRTRGRGDRPAPETRQDASRTAGSFSLAGIPGPLRSYRFIGVGWLLHTGWDVLHHLCATDTVPFAGGSSFGCAICDPVIALWCFAGAPSVYALFRRGERGRTGAEI